MSVFDWLFRRNRTPASEPLPPPVAPAPPSPPRSEVVPAPVAAAAPVADPYGTEFLPVTRAEIVDAAKGGNLLSTAFTFGRPSVIPPVTDPRTMLIDRALVTNGLLTPEELNEIHVVGEEYEKAKPTEANLAAAAGLAGDAAVRAYRAEKERRKAQKKTESAARKKARAEAVKKRRATDIIFLGRGVSGKLHLRLSDE